MNRIVKTRKESRDSDKFICKTNDDVNEWMDTFYVEGRNALFNLHCLWAWQEQERRHGELIAEVERLSFREKMLSEYGCEYCAGSGHVHRIDGDYLGVCDSCSAYEFNCAKHEIEKLKNENESLKKDAARYRWTTIEGNWVARMFGKWRAHIGEYGDSNPTDWFDTREEAIDVAMSNKE